MSTTTKKARTELKFQIANLEDRQPLLFEAMHQAKMAYHKRLEHVAATISSTDPATVALQETYTAACGVYFDEQYQLVYLRRDLEECK